MKDKKEKKPIFIKAYIPEDLHTEMRVYSARSKKVNNLIVIEALKEFLKNKK
jgi:hypothetical protein